MQASDSLTVTPPFCQQKMIPFNFIISQEVIGLIKFIAFCLTFCFFTWQIRRIAQHLDGRRELHHYVHPTDERPQLERGDDDGAPYYRRPLR